MTPVAVSDTPLSRCMLGTNGVQNVKLTPMPKLTKIPTIRPISLRQNGKAVAADNGTFVSKGAASVIFKRLNIKRRNCFLNESGVEQRKLVGGGGGGGAGKRGLECYTKYITVTIGMVSKALKKMN